MKLLYYSTAFHAPHGGSIQSISFYGTAARNPLVSELMLFPPSGSPQKPRKSRFENVRRLLRRNGLFQMYFFYRRNQFYLKSLYKVIEERKPDVVLIQLDSTLLQIKYLKKRFPKLIVSTVVNASPFSEPFRNIAFKGYYQTLERRMLSQSDCNIFISDALREGIMGEKVSNVRDRVIHNGVDTILFSPRTDRGSLRSQFDLPSDAFIVGYVGTLDVHKNMPALIQAFTEFTKRVPTSFLMIVGEGASLAELRELVVREGVEDKVRFSGWLSHDEIPSILNCLDVAVHHHANEYMSPLKIFEYLSVGVPVIGPDIPAVREIVVDQQHLLLTSGETSDIVRLLMKIYLDKDFASRMATAGRQLITENYTWERHANRVIEDLQAVLLS